MTTTVIGTLLLNYDEITGDEHVSISFDADFMEFDVYARLYYVDRAVDELLLATEPSDEDEDLEDEEDAEEDEDAEEEWDEESLA